MTVAPANGAERGNPDSAARLTLNVQGRQVGQTELRVVSPGTADYRRWIDISADAYPILRLQTALGRDAAFEEQRDLATREPEHRLIGAFRADVLVGGMRVYDFTMCVRGAQIFAGGVGSVAVGLEHKQRGIARDLITGFLAEYRERGAPLTTLYPFRPDFYLRMGFGYGAKMDQYRIALGTLPTGGARERVRRLGARDVEAFASAYARAQARTNGLLRREHWRVVARLASETLVTYGYDDGETLRGYVTVEVRLGKPGTWNRNELFVHELIYDTPAALTGLLAFLRSQSDQFATVVVNTQDPDLHFAFDDARNGSDRSLYPPVYHETNAQGVGIMYRVIDLPALVDALAATRFGELDVTLRVVVTDPFLPANAGAWVIAFRSGRPVLREAGASADVDLAVGVGDFSALVMGSVRLRSLVAYGRAVVSRPHWLEQLDAAFVSAPPQCLTRF